MPLFYEGRACSARGSLMSASLPAASGGHPDVALASPAAPAMLDSSRPQPLPGRRDRQAEREARRHQQLMHRRLASREQYERIIRPAYPSDLPVPHGLHIEAGAARRWNLHPWLTIYPNGVWPPSLLEWCEALPAGQVAGEHRVDAAAVAQLFDLEGRGPPQETGVEQLHMKMEWLFDANSPTFRFDLHAADALYRRLARVGQWRQHGLLDRALTALGADQATHYWYMRLGMPSRTRQRALGDGPSALERFADGVVEGSSTQYVVWRELIQPPRATSTPVSSSGLEAQYYLVEGEREPQPADFAHDWYDCVTERRTLFFCRSRIGAFALEFWLTPGMEGVLLPTYQLRCTAEAWFKADGALSQPLVPGRLCTSTTPYVGANKGQVFEEFTMRQVFFDSESEDGD